MREMEVIYTGLRQTLEMIAAAAVQEDVDVQSAFRSLVVRTTPLTHSKPLASRLGMDDCLVLVGGIVPQGGSFRGWKELGVAAVFLPGTSTDEIVKFLRET